VRITPVIGPPNEADLPALVGLLEELDRFYGVTEFPSADIRAARVRDALFGDPPAVFALVARWDSTLVGIATYSYHWPASDLRSSIFMKDLYVVERHRGDGIGARLLHELRAVAAGRGCSRVEWTADPWNEGAQRFYDRLGARRDGRQFYRWVLADQPHDGAADGEGGRDTEHDREQPGRLPRGVDAADEKPGHGDQADDGELLGHDAEA
jgi:GNAT superfamily N-acetyltransferase